MRYEITFDYLCPFARNAAEAVVNGLRQGEDWEVTFRPFSLSQVHVEAGAPSVFDDVTVPGVRALHWGVAVRDTAPDHFLDAHLALFAARHDLGLDISDEAVIRAALEPTGVDVEALAGVVASGAPARALAAEHTDAVERLRVFGVPTFIQDGVATFIRFMQRGDVGDLERALTLLDWHDLNEFKRTVRSR